MFKSGAGDVVVDFPAVEKPVFRFMEPRGMPMKMADEIYVI
jgi:hypothetical protein